MRHNQKSIRRSPLLLGSSTIAFVLTATTAAAQSSHVCSAWNVDRSVEVIAPASGTPVCEVHYRKPDENVPDQMLWRSSNSMAFCADKAQSLIDKLTNAGFDCREGALPPATASAQPTEKVSPASTQVAMTDQNAGQTPAAAPQNQSAPADRQPMPMGGVPYQRIPGWADTSWHLAGYADVTFIASDIGGNTTADFSSARFLPGFHFQYKDLVLFEAELEIEIDGDGETEFLVEYAQADIFLHDSATLVLGQFLSPVGQFQERLHPTWINRLADPPPGFGHDGVQPASDTGAMLRGGFLIGDEMIATYSVAVGNGPRLSHEGGVEFEAKGADDNSNKAVSGRVGFLPLPFLEVGGSFLIGDVSGSAEAEEGGEDGHDEDEPEIPLPDDMDGLLPTDAKVTLWGADAAYTRGPWDIRGEYLNATRDPMNTAFEGSGGVAALPELELEAWYGQIAYSLSGLTDHKIISRFEPVVRYGEFRITGLEELAEEAAEERLDIGLNYWIAPSIVARGVAQLRDFTARHDDEPDSETRFLLQLAYGF